MTHPFHPWCGREFVFVALRHTWGEDRVFFFGDDGTQKSLPRAWTDAADPDPFVEMAMGRSPFRVEDLGALVDLVGRHLADRKPRDCKANSAATVKGNSPDKKLRAGRTAEHSSVHQPSRSEVLDSPELLGIMQLTSL